MAIDKEALRETVFRHYEREVNANTGWNEERKNRELLKKQAKYNTAMRTETAGEYLYFSSLSPEELEKQLAVYEQDSDPDVTERFEDLKRNEQQNRLLRKKTEDPAGEYLRGLFAPETDSSGVRLKFADRDFENSIKNIQAEIDSVKIPVPEGFDSKEDAENAITCAVIGEFLRDDLIASTFDEMKRREASGGSSIPRYMDKTTGAKESFFVNVVDNDDERENMHVSRFVVPNARRSVAELSRMYSEGNKQPLANAVLNAFNSCYDRLVGSYQKGSQLYMFCIKTMNDCVKLLDSNALKGTVEIPEEKRRMLNYLSGEKEFFAEEYALKKELTENLHAQTFQPSGSKPMADPVFRAKTERLLAIGYIHARTFFDLQNADSIYGRLNNAELKNRAFVSRGLTAFEQLQNTDREALIEAVIEKYVRTESEEYVKIYNDDAPQMLSDITSFTMECGEYKNTKDVPLLVEYTLKCCKNYIREHPQPEYAPITAAMQNALADYSVMRAENRNNIEDMEAVLPALKAINNAIDAFPKPDPVNRLNLPDEEAKKYDLMDSIFNDIKNLSDFIAPGIKTREHDRELLAALEEKGVRLPGDVKDPLLTSQALAEKKKASAPERIKTEEEQNAERWFDSFTAKLSAEGISFENPLTLGLVKVYNSEFDGDAFWNTATENTSEAAEEVIRMGAKISAPAFIGNEFKEILPYRGDNYADFMKKALKSPADFTLEEKTELYRKAREGLLYIEHPSNAADAPNNIRYVKVDNGDTARFTSYISQTGVNYLHANDTYTEEDWRRFEAAGFNRADMDTVKQHGKALSDVNLYINTAYSRLLSDIDDNEPNEAKKAEKQKELTSASLWLRHGHRLSAKAYQHPDWFEDEAGAKQQNDLVKLSCTPGELRTAEENAVLEKDFTNYEECEKLEEKLMKQFGVKNVKDLPFDKICNIFGEPYGEGPDYKTFNKIYSAAVDGEMMVLNGKTMLYAATADMFLPAAKHEVCAKEADSLLKELKATDSAFSKDSDEYTALMRGLKELPAQIRGLAQAPVVSERALPLLARTVDMVAGQGRAYQEKHKGLNEFSSRQLARLTVINKLNKLNDFSAANAPETDKKAFDLAFKITLEKAVAMAGSKDKKIFTEGKNALLNYNILKESALVLSESAELKALIGSKTPEEYNKLMTAKPGAAGKALVESIHRGLAAARAPQRQNQPENSMEAIQNNGGEIIQEVNC